MKKQDIIFITCIILFFLPFFTSETVYSFYKNFNSEHGMIMSFLKFAILSTTGEVIGLRISAGVYNRPGFGIIPRAVVWGFLGMVISMAMTIFSVGVPVFLETVGINGAVMSMIGDISWKKVFVAFCISVAMNSIFAPVFMTFHKITDTHLLNNGGKLSAFLRPIPMDRILSNLNWNVQWNFVFKKTIPFFWFPAHTITFLLPGELRVLFAALLGVALGILLALATHKK